MFRKFWNAFLGREPVKPEIIRFSKEHTLTDRAVNVLRSAGVEEGLDWDDMVDRARIALAAYAKLDNVILPPLNVPKNPVVPEVKSETKVAKAPKTTKKPAAEKKPKTVAATKPAESKKETEKTAKPPVALKVVKPKTSKVTRKSKKAADSSATESNDVSKG